MASIDYNTKSFNSLISEIEDGVVKIPQFQRQFVWEKKKSAKLIDSMVKGYPIGTFIYWRTDEYLRSVRNIGNITLPERKKDEKTNYIIDGQQRITSIFAAIKGETIEREDGDQEDFSELYVDLEASPDEDIIVTDKPSNHNDKSYIKLKDLIDFDVEVFSQYNSDKLKQINSLRQNLTGYNINTIVLKNASIEEATDVFTRMNTGGKALTLFDIMVAKTYVSGKFDLHEKYNELNEQLEALSFSDIPPTVVLQVVCLLLSNDIGQKAMLNLDKNKFVDKWPKAIECIKLSVEFFKGYGIPASKLLPYPSLVIPFSYYFFKKNKKSMPTGIDKERLIDFFWRVSLGSRYSKASNSNLLSDIGKINEIIENRLPKYEWSIDVTPELFSDRKLSTFKVNSSFSKSVLCLYAIQKPRSFSSGQEVSIDNKYLTQSNSRNYHHFFPKSFLSKNKKKYDNLDPNHILNITMIEANLNQADIKDKAPSKYIKKFQEENRSLKKTLLTHLIGDFTKFGITNDNYDQFLKNRAEMVCKQIKSNLIEQKNLAD